MIILNKKKGFLKGFFKFILTVFAILGICLIILMGVGFYFFKTCTPVYSMEQFISSADNCHDARFKSEQDIGTFEYRSEDCVFTKTLVSLNKNESQEMKDLLEGKTLTCKYEQFNFNEKWADSLLYDIEDCEGELKEIIGQLMLFT